MKPRTPSVIIAALFSVGALVLATGTHAEEGRPPGPPPGGQKPGPNPEMFQKMKVQMLEQHQKRIRILQQSESCIQSATAHDQLKACHEKERQAMDQLHEQIKQNRDAMREQRRDPPPPPPAEPRK